MRPDSAHATLHPWERSPRLHACVCVPESASLCAHLSLHIRDQFPLVRLRSLHTCARPPGSDPRLLGQHDCAASLCGAGAGCLWSLCGSVWESTAPHLVGSEGAAGTASLAVGAARMKHLERSFYSWVIHSWSLHLGQGRPTSVIPGVDS